MMLCAYLTFAAVAAVLWAGTEERHNWRTTPLLALGKTILFGTLVAPFFVVCAIGINCLDALHRYRSKSKAGN